MDDEIGEINGLKIRFEKFEKNFKKCSQANRTKGYLEGRLKGIEEIWNSVCESNATINSLKTDDNANIDYFENDEFGALEEKYFQLVGQINEHLSAFNPQPKTNQNVNNNNNQQQNQQQNNQSKVKLPKISLPSFSGSYHAWLSFKNRFTNLIHNSASLSQIEKLEYLKSCVTGEAERTIQRYQITDQNYELAWNQLNEKYDNQRILQVTQVEMIIDRKLIKTESAKELRELIDVTQECLESLKNLNVDTSTWDIMIIVLITRKLPLRTRELWEEELKPADVPTYQQLCQFLEKRFRTLESLELIGKSEMDKGGKPHFNNQNLSRHTQHNKHRSNCLACGVTSHSLLVCEKFLNMPLSNRSAFVNAKGICRNCLAMSHTLPECKSIKTCFKCSRKHHTLLHREESNVNNSTRNHYQFQPNQHPDSRVQSQTYVTNNSSRNTQPTQNSYRNQTPQNDQPSQNHQSTQENPTMPSNQSNSRRALTTTSSSSPNLAASSTNDHVSQKQTLFPTAVIKVKSAGGTVYSLRALLDQCSDEAYIKESVAKMLGLKQTAIPAFEVTGLSDAVTSTVRKATKFEMVIQRTESLEVQANVVKTLIELLPKTNVAWPKDLFENIQLADPNFATPGNVDVMLGGQQYAELLLEGMLKKDGYLAQNTKLGWIISGKNSNDQQPAMRSTCLLTRASPNIDELLEKFWRLEEQPKRQKHFTKEEQECEAIFKNSYRRTSEGRVQVKLPFKEPPFEVLGTSRNLAVARWLAMERKLEKEPGLKHDYMEAMQEYLNLGHMTRTSTTEKYHGTMTENGEFRYSCYYIPHHAVVKEESKTTKTRIVFDASAKTSSKKSLNDTLMIGPTIQESLIVRLMKWREHKYALRGDVTKMYRQIKVYEEDEDYQRIVFRFEKEDPIEDFKLNTLTFGTASAPFMAIRTLKELASDEADRFPIGSKVVNSEFHVDDLLTGGDSIEAVKNIWSETRDLLETAKLPMRKWSSNNNNILEQIPKEDRDGEIKANEIQIDDSIKTLGIGWLPMADQFFLTIPQFDYQEQLTKRTFLSQAAKLFDPLGWLGPAIIKPKIMFQSLWKQKLKWDDKISANLAHEWISFRGKLHQLEQIRIPRWFGFLSNGYSIELHGFCDASVLAYGAVIYIKSTNSRGNSQIQLVLAKSRVAPVQTVRLPRLELCGAVVLANVIRMVGDELKISKINCWTDSTITLDWINSSPDLYKTFVANRVAEIQSLTNPIEWRHVDGKQNPADCLSRGLDPEELRVHDLWWHGPSWLEYPKEQWPKNPNVRNPEEDVEKKSNKVLTTVANKPNEVLQELLNRYSSFQLLLRVSARIRTLSSKDRPKQKVLLLKEIEKERIFWIKRAQEAEFSEEIHALKNKRPLHGKSKLLALYPFLDGNGLLRVGGRLKEALIDYESKHQIIIPKDSTIAKLIINDAHLNTKHGGTQLTMTYTRTQYWIVATRNTVRNHIRRCVICHRYTKRTQEQLMGNLPEARVNMSRAFLHTGVDYAGPMEVLTISKPGKRQTTKGYVAVFVCLCIKAVHLELVSSYTSEAFLAAFTRFCSRRGLPSNMYSDNAKTFVGAKNEVDRDYEVIKEKLEPELAEVIIKDNIQWSFIPPQAPHWGGIWEAGVKSMKHHLRRMLGESVHTFEEYTTMLTEIEACLNSRPLCPVSNDPNDFSVLTPAHFLIGDNLLARPRPSLLDIHTSRLSKWKQISQKVDHFRKRWKAEYLSQLQYRNKWMRQCKNVEVGDLVLIKDDGLPPSKWLLGRIIETFPDEEGLVRKVNVKTATTTLMRSIHKISILPIDKPVVDTTSE